jgi:hypothetical protein
MKSDALFTPRGPQSMLDTLWSGAGGPAHLELLRQNAYISMIETAQNVTDRYGLTREEIDAFALHSHPHAAQARSTRPLAKEIVPVAIPATRRSAERFFEHDETIRDDTTLDSLAKLPAPPGTTQITAGNSTPLSDGSSAAVIASDDVVAGLGVAPFARIVGSAVHALEPGLMGIAPAWAMTKVITAAGIAPDEMGVWEVHEAFAAQALGMLRELSTQFKGFEVPDDRLNLNGAPLPWAIRSGPRKNATCSPSPSRCGSETLATAFSVCARAQGRVWRCCSRTVNGPDQGSAFDGAWLERGGVQVALAEPKDLKAQVVVLVRFPDPFHPDTAGGLCTAFVIRPYDGEDLFLAVAEGIVGQSVPRLGCQPPPPRPRSELVAQLQVVALRRQRKNLARACDASALGLFDHPPATRAPFGSQRCGDPSGDHRAHLVEVVDAIHRRGQPPGDLRAAVDVERPGCVIVMPRTQPQPRRTDGRTDDSDLVSQRCSSMRDGAHPTARLAVDDATPYWTKSSISAAPAEVTKSAIQETKEIQPPGH